MYGRGFFPRIYSSEWLPRLLLKQSAETEQIPVELFTDQYRSMFSVLNATRAIKELSLTDFEGTIHLGGPQSISRYEFGKKLCTVLNISQDLVKKATSCSQKLELKRPRDVSLNIVKARSILKTELLSIDEGLREIFA